MHLNDPKLAESHYDAPSSRLTRLWNGVEFIQGVHRMARKK
jgi:hypothetical protein